MPTTYGLLKFHKGHGPSSLFERAAFMFLDPPTRQLNLPRAISKTTLPPELTLLLELFNIAEWELMWVRVRDDKGKFVHSAWRKKLQDDYWWIVIGYSDVILRVFKTDTLDDGSSHDVVRFGDQYTFVERVNRELMVEEYEGPSPKSQSGLKVGFGESAPDFFFVRRRRACSA